MERTTIYTARTKLAEHRQWIYLLVAGIGIFLLFPQIAGFNRTVHLLVRADPIFLALGLIAEAVRYLFSAGTTRVLAGLFRRVLPLGPLAEAFFGGAAANRTFSTGGAPGMLIRLLFLAKQEIPAGSVAVIFLIEDIAGFIVGSLIFLAGILSLINARPSNQFIAYVGLLFGLGVLVLVLGATTFYRHRAWVGKAVHAPVRLLNRLAQWIAHRPLVTADQVERALNEFYAGMSLARRAPSRVAMVFALNLLRTVAGIAALYFAFLALDWTISPGVLIVLYTSASVLSTVSAVPGEVAIMGGSWAILTLSFGVPRDVAAAAMLLSRTIAFWLPIPIGYFALWNLRRQRYL